MKNIMQLKCNLLRTGIIIRIPPPHMITHTTTKYARKITSKSRALLAKLAPVSNQILWGTQIFVMAETKSANERNRKGCLDVQPFKS